MYLFLLHESKGLLFLQHVRDSGMSVFHQFLHCPITKTGLFKYIENLTTKKMKVLDKNFDIFFIFLLKT